MKPFIKAAGLGLVLVTSSMFAHAAEAAQKIGYVATGPLMAQLAKQSNVQEKLRVEFKDRIAKIERLETKMKMDLDKLKRNGELMSEDERVKLQRNLQSMDSEYKLEVANLREDERKRGAEEQRKLAERIQKAIESVAKKEGYSMVLERQVVHYASPKDDISEKVLKAVK
ncbi:OmpH family outer membrane protein [Enterovibrio nigricans]|uniref:Chaperone protein skp n=1 Tax=Enterovibrio nigricans DSM 22720 TaxID=1121868 RepID=A0A1T4UC03_9GAMM|nr:OmpH family outer membrane protein [Enterovibrio nigricans]PKF51466.1 molecular chaperone [Enterovibrio nigricans]SKA50136.1 outer membrane protein [Enterovibrio nigricans DSM 22720]